MVLSFLKIEKNTLEVNFEDFLMLFDRSQH